MPTDFSAPHNFINRELSWLEFNKRVLEEAEDPSQPLMERVKFLAIFSSNLDEFFEIRVAGLKQQIDSGATEEGPDELTPEQVLEAIQKRAHELVKAQYTLWNEKIVPALKEERIRIKDPASLNESDRKWAARHFHNEVLPVLTPLAVDSSHPFPQVVNKSVNLILRAHQPKRKGEPLFAIVQVPRSVARLIRLPARGDDGAERFDYVSLSALIKHHISELFAGLKLDAVHAFRVTRNSDLYFDDEEVTNLLATLEQELLKARRGDAVRLEVEEDCPAEFQKLLLERYELGEADLYKVKGPMSMGDLDSLFGNEAFARLKDRPFVPVNHPDLPRTASLYDVVRKRDVLLHHPYHSFESIVEMVECAAVDPHVLAIKMTLYRTSGDSPIVAALSEAAINGKQVTAIVEVKARFDEANNIRWAQKLEKAGAHVVYGVVGLKTHCKALLIVRRDEDCLRQYVHLGTGNYNPKTARLYTDLSLLTSNKEMATEVAALFNTLTGLVDYTGFRKLIVAPFDMVGQIKSLIQRERDFARAGKPASIVAKVNSLVDEEIITALYEASSAGVKIDLIVRGICCLRPRLPGISENIRVISVVGRFLEHSRIFSFHNNGTPEVYLASADWMPRNLRRRVEIAFRIEDPRLVAELTQVILPAFLHDRVKARELQPDGSYVRVKRSAGKNAIPAQQYFRARARQQAGPAKVSLSASVSRLVPLGQPPEEVTRAAAAAPDPAATARPEGVAKP